MTLSSYDAITSEARTLFVDKGADYGASWTILRPASLTDQIFIKAARLRSLEEKQEQRVEDDIRDDYIGLINYCLMALIQLHRSHYTELDDMEAITELYDTELATVRELMINKNHDYGEAWRMMRISSMTDMILMKLLRIKSIEENDGYTRVSESIAAGFQDIINYAIFALILMDEQSVD